jgi:hypothetical protein
MIRKFDDFTTEITTALVGTSSLPMLLDLFEAGKLKISPMITHGKRSGHSYILKGKLTLHFKTSNLQRWKRHMTSLEGQQRQKP